MGFHVATFDAVNLGYIPQVDGNNNAIVYPSIAAATAAGVTLDNAAVKTFVVWSDTQMEYETPEVVVTGQYVA